METNTHIQHPGFVTANENGRISVSLLASSGCSSCHKSLCVLGDTGVKQVKVNQATDSFCVGEEVMVRINPASGYAAVAWLYLVPFALIMVVMITLLAWQYPEGWAGICSLGILVPYYAILYFLRDRMRKQCKIEIIKR